MSKPALLYLTHRIPYPPNKGDKVRSFNLLRHLARRYSVHLATFVDDPADLAHVDTLRQWCATLHCEPLHPLRARVMSLRALLSGEALTLPYYRSAALARWVGETVAAQGITQAVAFSSSMAQYLEPLPAVRLVADYCDVDSLKWTQYAARRVGPMAWLYRREGRTLLAFERHMAARAAAVTFVSEAEAQLFRDLAPEVAARVRAVGNGVDADYFSPEHDLASPYAPGTRAVVFTGAMDYWPNIDAVLWFAREVWPQLRADAGLRFYIVGMNPAPAVQALSADAQICVTGTVPDVRPYLRHGAVVVAPLQVARGVQNKVLEAMAIARPVVASPDAALGIDARNGEEFLVADTPAAYAGAVRSMLDAPERAATLGAQARRCVVGRYSWHAHLAQLDTLLDAPV